MFRNRYGRNLRTTVGASAAPYGYTLTIWTTGAVLVHARGLPDTLDALMFMAGAVIAFGLIGSLAFGGINRSFREQPRRSALWGNFHFFSVGAAIGTAALIARYIDNDAAWSLTSFLGTTSYLLVLGIEFAIADERDPAEE